MNEALSTNATMAKKGKDTSQSRPELSRLELEIMDVVWELGDCSSAEVIAAYRKKRPLAPTTIRTVLTNLRKKGYLEPIPTIERLSHSGHRQSGIGGPAAYERPLELPVWQFSEAGNCLFAQRRKCHSRRSRRDPPAHRQPAKRKIQMNAIDSCRALLAAAMQESILSRLLLASLEFAVLALAVGGLVSARLLQIAAH